MERLDITIDGADEFDPGFALIKGGGGALLREKIIAQMSDAFVVVADASKQVSILGAFSVPVEIVAYGWERTADAIRQALEAPVVLRRRPTSGSYSTGDVRIEASDAGGPFVTDNGNLILDVHVGPTLVDPKGTEACLHGIAGVVGRGSSSACAMPWCSLVKQASPSSPHLTHDWTPPRDAVRSMSIRQG